MGEDGCKNENCERGSEPWVRIGAANMSYYKKDRVDEVMNECMRKMSRGQVGSSPAKQYHLSL